MTDHLKEAAEALAQHAEAEAVKVMRGRPALAAAYRLLADQLRCERVVVPADATFPTSHTTALADMVKRAREACGCHGCAPGVRPNPYSSQFAIGDDTPRPSQCLATALLQAELR